MYSQAPCTEQVEVETHTPHHGTGEGNREVRRLSRKDNCRAGQDIATASIRRSPILATMYTPGTTKATAATLNVKSNSSCDRLMDCLIKRFFPQLSGIPHDDGLFISKSYFEDVHILEHTTCLHQRGKNKRSLHRLKRHIGPSDALLVAYELFITELKIQQIV